MNKLITNYIKQLETNPIVQLLENKKTIPFTSITQEALSIVAYHQKHPQSILIVKHNLYHAQRLYDKLSQLTDDCVLFSANESLRVEAIAASPEMIGRQVETLSSLLQNPYQIVITCVSGLVKQLPLPSDFSSLCMHFEIGQTYQLDTLKSQLLQAGYYQTSHIDQPLSFAWRGGIVDIYSINYEQPIRIEFFDNEIESIRFFDITTQKTISTIDQVQIVPASCVLFTPQQIQEIETTIQSSLQDNPILKANIDHDIENLQNQLFESKYYPYFSLLSSASCIIDYLDQPLILFSDLKQIHQSYQRLNEETISYLQEMIQENLWISCFAVWHDLHQIEKNQKIIVEDPFMDNVSNIEELILPNEPLAIKLKLLKEYKYVLFNLSDKTIKRLIDTCIEQQIPYALNPEQLQEGFNISTATLNLGFYDAYAQIAFISDEELFEIRHHEGRFEKKFLNAEVISNHQELQTGDYVVHASYGVGQFVGIETRTIQNVTRDFLRIIYKGNAELLVPLEQFRLVRKFVSSGGAIPKLNKLGSGEWEKTKQKLQENVENIAHRLIQLYATRTQKIGYAFSKDSPLQKQFEETFPYDLTKDQEKAVIDVKKDMESPIPMDRLVCGDVGFGKTEIAIRASFKAVNDGKQVAVLCPTTILAEQHFRTFNHRYKEFPFIVKVLDRFVQPSVVKQIIKDVKDGKIDILIGTHRILSKDIVFKDLGLLVIDEEQRFGVEHKERIKELKNSIDVLTLSATPIPRTLQMSLIGIRQLSQLETPPSNRYNVQTYVVEKNWNLITEAIEKELSRNGQIFYLYNNVSEITNVARTIQKQVPGARVGIVHGQMDRDTIENMMMEFNNHELDILVCTTIVENGIDIPNANTIFVDNSQDFGLAQIYQIKGRVGRSNRIAYAYLLVPPLKQLSEVAQKRLQAVKEFAKLGSGYKIAMRDLTIRGAGDLLGENQSGFINTVGIDMYIEMLEEAIARQQGKVKQEQPQIKVNNIQVSSYIPENFTPDDYDKLNLYQTIDHIATIDELKQFQSDIVDQYGKLPSQVLSLFEKRHIDILTSDQTIHSYKEAGQNIIITFAKEYSATMDGVKLFEIMTKISKDIQLTYKNECISILFKKSKDYLQTVIQVIEQAKEAIKHEN